MKRRKPRSRFSLPPLAPLAALLLLLLPGRVFSQSPLDRELRETESRLATPGLSPVERAISLRRLARLQGLSGDYGAAAETWNRAFSANPDHPDYSCLLEAARCFIALGEWNSCERVLSSVFSANPGPAPLREAHWLSAVSRAFRTGSATPLAALLEAPEFSGKKPAILFMLWRLENRDAWRTRLLAECPGSPEAAVAAGKAGGPGSPMWFFFPEREAMALAPAEPVPGAAPPENSPAGPGQVFLQTGLFQAEANARTMEARLRSAGFTPVTLRRELRGAASWVVGVNAPDRANDVILRLKEAGIEAFPVYP